MENPYWHPTYKHHLIDRNEIRLLCFDISNIVNASRSKRGNGFTKDERFETPIEQLCFKFAEDELSRRLLRLALLIRTFDDTMAREDAELYRNHRQNVDRKYSAFGSVYAGRAELNLRECSNKIIHAEDVRPTYETDHDRDDPNAVWGMTGDLELEGKQADDKWEIAINLDSYLDGILDLIAFGEAEIL